MFRLEQWLIFAYIIGIWFGRIAAGSSDAVNLASPPQIEEGSDTDGNDHPDLFGNAREVQDQHSESEGNATVVLVENVTATAVLPPTEAVPPLESEIKEPAQAAAEEHKSSMAIFFILFVIVLSILLVRLLLKTQFHYLPESVAVMFLGIFVGGFAKLTGKDWTSEEAFSPNIFFLVLLPPIIFESGYNLHKGNFFANIGSILVFAIFGTFISAMVLGGGIILLGEADLIYKLSPVEGFAFGSMVSAVDPVATLAIFQAMDVDPVLYMLVFGESVLNDAVAIVLTNTIMELGDPSMAHLSSFEAVATGLGRFCAMFFASAALGVAAALTSALLLKHVDLRKTPSLEFAIMLVFAYLPYGLAEGIHLSGIMAILFCAIVMSHYTHFNLSPITQINMQMTFRTLAWMSETCVFAYLGMAFFTFPVLHIEPVFVSWTVVLCLFSRAVNIFPLSWFLNHFRDHAITKKMQCIMWFSGLRGAIAFALSMHTSFTDKHTRHVVITATLILVAFTTVILGGATLPMTKLLERLDAPVRRRRRRRRVKSNSSERPTLIKTQGIGGTIEAKVLTELSESESTGLSGTEHGSKQQAGTSNVRVVTAREKGFARIDSRYLRPFFTRKFTSQEKKENTRHLTDLALQWYEEAQSESEDEDVVNTHGMPNVPLHRFEPTVRNGGTGTGSGVVLNLDVSDSDSVDNDQKTLLPSQ